jgi:hypothetical protein
MYTQQDIRDSYKEATGFESYFRQAFSQIDEIGKLSIRERLNRTDDLFMSEVADGN